MKKLLFYLLLLFSMGSYAQIEAYDDSFSVPSFAFGSIGNVLTYDFIDGSNVTNPSDVILTYDNTSAPSISVDANGNVNFFGAPGGLHVINYTICRASNPTECDTAQVFIYVNPTMDAVNDSFVLATSGSTTSSVLNNDTQDGMPVNSSFVSVTPSTVAPYPGITINFDGTISVASYVPVGTYYVDYQLCYINSSPPSCDVATVSIEVQSSSNTGSIGCNISTGIDANGNPLPDNAIDPFWRIASSPNPPGTPALVQYSFPGYWMPTPEATTFARWLNASGSFFDLPGDYTFERDIVVPAGTGSLDLNFSITWDDTFVSLELVRPDLTTIPLSVTPPSTWYYLTPPIVYSETSPMAGTWKIRAKVNFYDQVGAFLLSGNACTNCQTLYVDNDNDGYDNGSMVDCTGTIPTGYSANTLGADCDDNNASIGTALVLPSNLQTGLLAQYTFNGGNTGDFSGNGHHLMNTHGAVAASDRNGNASCALEFDNLPSSNNQYLTTTATAFLNGLTEYSVSCWYKAKDPSRGIVDYEVLVGRDTGSLTCPDRVGQWSLGLYDCRYAVFGRENSVWQAPGAPCNEVEVWHHLTATYNQVGNTIKLYKDGILQNTSTGNAGCGSSSDIGDLFLGKGFTGVLDDVFIHNREITAAEVTQLYGLGSSCCSANPCTTLIMPSFATPSAICSGDVVSPLPTISSNGISGTWSPALDNTTTTTYTFTPNSGQCATTTTLTILVNPAVTPTFTYSNMVCQNTIPFVLPTLSQEGITGTWSPAIIDTSLAGDFIYTFTPDAGQCASITTITVTVTPTILPSFPTVGPICVGDTETSLPIISNEGITGEWLPAFNNTVTTTYTFYPYPTQCATPTTLTVVVTPLTTPTFNAIAPICVGDTLTALPSSSIEGITGTWSPTLNNTASTTYTFTPDAGQCAELTTLTITVNPQSTNITTMTSCGAYTWPVNGVTYTTSGIYSEIVGCTIGLLYLTIETPTTWYVDADGDGAGNPAVSVTACSQPTGYVNNGNDCNDNNVGINPCAAEIRNDGIDNNCNGFIDEITTRLVASQCGINMTSLSQLLVAQSVTPPAGSSICGYRFKVTKWVGGAPSTNLTDIQVVTRTTNTFSFVSHLAQYAYNTTYSIQVSVCINGVWQPYGADCCTVRCDKLSKVQASQCGATLSSMSESIFAEIVNFISLGTSNPWRFEITQVSPGTGFGTVQTFDTNLRRFTMNNFTTTYGTTYSVRVAFLNVDGTWSPFGPACTITTPPFPTTQIQSTQCGSTASSGTQVIWADGISSTIAVPSQYRFRLSNATLSYSQTKDNANRNFFLNQFIGLAPSTTYNVEVSMEIGGVFGPYGTVCTITTPAVFKEASPLEVVTAFDAVTYPNPATDYFQIEIKTASNESITIAVYDLQGRLIENQQTEADTIQNLLLGSSYPSGIYHVVVSQGSNTKTLKAIKR